MRKFIAILIPILIIGCFIFVMESASFLKTPRSSDDDVIGLIRTIENDIGRDDWKTAKENAEKLSQAWRIVAKRVQFSAERNQLIDAELNIARAKGYIEANDKIGTLAELYEIEEHWKDIGN